MILRAGFLAVAHKLQEAATAMCHEDIRTRLSDSLNDMFRGTSTWCYVVAVFGDDKSGDVVYSCDRDLKKAAYTITGANCTIDTANAVDVQPLTTYEVETDDVAIGEAGARNSKRDMVQLQTIHDSAAALGANCSMQESHKHSSDGAIKLTEASAFLVDIPIREAFKPGYQIKLIAPGKGSSAFYTAEALKKAATDRIFKAGTPMRIDHPTAAEESARPEGSVKDWGAVLAKDAYYLESHPSGPGLFSEIKPFSDHVQTIDEKGPYAGVSIRANGNALIEAGRTVMRDGVPVLKEFTSAEGADMVTRAGAGGMFLSEAARSANPTEGGAVQMDQAEVTKLIESAVKAAQAPLMERALRGDAREEATRAMRGVSLPEQSKQRVIESVMAREIPTTDGALDSAKLIESITAAAKAEGEYVASLTGGGAVRGMGLSAAPVKQTADQLKESKERAKEEFDEEVAVYQRLGLTEAAAQNAARGRAA